MPFAALALEVQSFAYQTREPLGIDWDEFAKTSIRGRRRIHFVTRELTIPK